MGFFMATTVQRVTFSLPPLAVNQLTFVASQLGVSRSALMSAMLGELLPPLVHMAHLAKAANEGSESDAKRYRGELVDILNEQVRKLNAGYEGLQDDLFCSKE